MAFSKKPTDWLAGYSSSSGEITLGTADGNNTLPMLTDADADADTGDIRTVIFAIIDACMRAWEATAPEDRPVRMGIGHAARTVGIDTAHSYRFDFNTVAPDSGEVLADEPVGN